MSLLTVNSLNEHSLIAYHTHNVVINALTKNLYIFDADLCRSIMQTIQNKTSLIFD